MNRIPPRGVSPDKLQRISALLGQPGWWRRFVWLLPLSLLCVLVAGWLYQTERDAAISRLVAEAQDDIANLKGTLAQTLTEGAIDTARLASDQDLMHVLAQGEESWPQFADDLVALLQTNPAYRKARLIDLAGQERLRVSLNGVMAGVDPASTLINQRGRDYVEAGQHLARGHVYLSALDLTQTQGKVDMPWAPVVRFAAPVFDLAGQRRGVVVLNMQANHLFQRLGATAHGGGEPWLVNAGGEWMMGGRIEDQFARQTGTGKLLGERDPELAAEIRRATDGWFKRGSDVWVFSQFRPLDRIAPGWPGAPRVPLAGDADRLRWTIVLHFDDAVLAPRLAPVNHFVATFLLLGLALCVVIAVLLSLQAAREIERQRSESAFHRLFELAPVGTVVLDAAWNGLYFNRYWQNLSGLSVEASLGQGWCDCLDEGDWQRLQAALQHAAEGREQTCELRLKRPDGATCWANCQVALIPANGRRDRRYILGLTDANERKQAEARTHAALQLLQGVIEGSGDPIVAVDSGFAITLCNPAFGQAFGMLYGDAPAVGTNLLDWLAPRGNDRQVLLTHFAQAMQGVGTQVRLSLGPVRRTFDGAFSPLYGQDETVAGAILFARDVTEMARMQAKVVRNEELFRAVFAGSLDAVFVLEAVRQPDGSIVDFRYVEVSGPPITQDGLQRDDFVGRLVSERHPAVTQQLGYLDHCRRVVETGEPFIEEVYLDGDDVPPGWYENRIVSLGWGVTLTARNITDRKQAEMALVSSEAMQRNLLDCSPYMIAATDQTGRISVFNRAGETMLGYSAAELVGVQTPLVFHDASNLARVASQLSEEHGVTVEPNSHIFDVLTANGPDTREWLFVTKDGRKLPVLLTVTMRFDAEGNRLGTMGIAYDISQQRAVEEQRDRLFAVVEAMPDAVAMADIDGHLMYVNPAARRLRGIADDEALDTVDIRRGYTDWSYHMIRTVAIPQAISGKPWQGDTQWVRSDGTIFDARQLFVAPSMHGKPPAFTASIVHDLSEIRAMEAKMVEEEALLNSVLESVQDAIVVINEQGVVQGLNPAVAEVFGYGLHKVMGQPVNMLMPTSHVARHQHAFARYIETGERSGHVIGHRIEVPGRRQDGTDFLLELTVSEIKLGKRRLFVGVMRDISERKAFEARLLDNIDELETMQSALNSANEQLLNANFELSRMAQMDGLTGVANRRAFDLTLEREWERAARNNRPLALLMVDVDHFKKFNDGYGHQAGDECLKQVAALLRQSVERPADFVARYGGEEFAVILPDTDSQGAMEVAGRLHRLLADAAITHAYSDTSAIVTVSAGAAALLPLHGVKADVLLATADRALYRAKEGGRNRTVAATT
jgi:diguanylate cyclase (GGDEF)-like protein/PAS domain S-box-containing protein